MNKYNWLPDCELKIIDKIIANENDEKCQVLYAQNNYDTDIKIETNEFKYQVLH